jgi:hypothetical protein
MIAHDSANKLYSESITVKNCSPYDGLEIM